MKCKRIFKVAGVLALTVALLVSSAVVSFAATYTTTTKYLDQNTIEVTSVASDLSAGDMATYVAYEGSEGFSEGTAVYIDQATADDTGVVTFRYQADSDKVKATVNFGGSKESSARVPDVEGYNVYVTVDGVAAADPVIVPTVDAGYEGDLAREIPVAIENGYAVASVTVDEQPVEAWYVKNGAVVIYSNVIKADANVVITTEKVEEVAVVLSAVKSEAANTVTAFAKATCGKYADYGILIGTGDVALDGAKNYDEAANYDVAVKLPALGMSNKGVFCVEVEDAVLGGATVNVAAYAGTEVTAAESVAVMAAVAE